jgi:hypothetical protein
MERMGDPVWSNVGVWHTPVDLPGSQRTFFGSMTREDVQWNQATAGMPYILYSNKNINILLTLDILQVMSR